MAAPGRTIVAITIVLLVLFLIGIVAFSSLFLLLAQNSAANSTLPPSELNLTAEKSTTNAPEPTPSFTGAIIVGITRPVAIQGKKGFSPADISIKTGDSITWSNNDPERKRNVLIFQRGREQNKFFSSPALWPEKEWEHTFWEEGEYNYWTTAYGVEGKVIVTPCKNRFCPHQG